MNMDYHYTDKEDITGAGVSRKKYNKQFVFIFVYYTKEIMVK